MPDVTKPKFSRRWAAAIILALLLVGLFLTNKGLVLAAIVNGKPIFRWELTNSLMSRFGKQTLEGMISERLIADEAKKSGVVVSKADVDAKEADIVKGLGANVKIEDVLKFQGMTKEDFDSQILLQLTVEKLLGKDITITDADIEAYIASQSATLTATEPASMREEAKAAILNQKVSEKIQPWFMSLKDKAKILRFL